MTSRRKFIQQTTAGAAALTIPFNVPAKTFRPMTDPGALVLSTWNFGLKANEEAWKVLKADGRALDAVCAGVKIPEADPKVTSVGYGGLPDRDGRVTLDSCVMDEFGNAGSVCAIEHIMHPSSVARLVMEKTPHVILVGEGALQFAIDQGFKKENLLTPESEQAWKNWLKTGDYKPINWENNHDTIGMIAIDSKGNLSGCCTTSGLAYKMHGRVGDSSIIGAGLFVDNEVGAATATGNGEYVIKVAGTAMIVELMRQGKSPVEACHEVVMRVAKKFPDKVKDIQTAFIAINKHGEYGGYALRKGFQYAHYNTEGFGLSDSEFFAE